MPAPFEYATSYTCRRCGPRPAYRFSVTIDGAGLRRIRPLCVSCYAGETVHNATPIQGDVPPRETAELKLLRRLPPLGTEAVCPRCERDWPVNQRCRGYKSTHCNRWEPHYHRICVTCATEIMERDSSRKPRKNEEVID